ncbi:MAG: hypothetical protein BWK78_01815, partial [Thiotrichaceae bacterium IS1]
MKPSLYLETSLISYNMMVATHQQITREWWETRRLAFELFVSPLVINEVSQGNATEATKRLAMLKNIPTLEPNNEVAELALAFLQEHGIPHQA